MPKKGKPAKASKMKKVAQRERHQHLGHGVFAPLNQLETLQIKISKSELKSIQLLYFDCSLPQIKYKGEMKDMDLDGIVKRVDELKDEVKDIKEINKVLMDKLQKAYNDRVELRATNHNLTNKMQGVVNETQYAKKR